MHRLHLHRSRWTAPACSIVGSATTAMQVAALLTALAGAGAAQAVPSFASQTGMPCEQCHTVGYGPALTPYGRQFKLNGYVWGEGKTMPVALMVQGGYTKIKADLPEPLADHTSVNNNLSMDQASLFLAGRISEHIGGFAQITYSGPDRATSWDNVDLRYAHPMAFGDNSAVVGVSINNSPTAQDLWNSTPTWGYPYIGSELAPTPGTSAMLGGLGQSVLGASVYAMFNDRYYVELGAYRGMSDRWLKNVGLDGDANVHMVGAAPYARAAIQFDGPVRHASIGLVALDAKFEPDASIGLRDRYTDIGLDATYQWLPNGPHQLSINAALTHEKRSLDASVQLEQASNVSSNLTFFSFDATYAYERTWSVAAGVFSSHGDSDSTLYSVQPLEGSLNGKPDSRGYSLQLEYIPFGKEKSLWRPWLNVRTGLQYVGYSKFNGGNDNYDGFGRSASDNNTLFAYLWIIL
ncbi:MAG: cytochrome C [Pseudomonadota bacterium]